MSNSKPSKWCEVKERGGLTTLYLMLYLYRFGGRFLCKWILHFIILWYWLFSRTARQASLFYLRQVHVFAAEKSPFRHTPNWRHSYLHLMQFGESILDKMAGWLGHFPQQNISLNGHEHFQQHYNKGAIIIVSHFGNIELLRAIKSEHVQKINILVYQKHATQFNAFLKKLNAKVDVNLVAVDELGMETALILQDKVEQGEWIIVAADRVPVQSQRVQDVRFLGEVAAWPQGTWILANLLKVPVMAVFCYQVKQHFHVHIHLIAERLNLPRQSRDQAMQAVMRSYVVLVEHYCLRAPYQWFNFYHFWKS